MRYSLAASGLLGLAAALPQNINIEAALAVPTPTVLGPDIEATAPPSSTYDSPAAASTVAAAVKSEGTIQKREEVWDENVAAFIDPDVYANNATMRRRSPIMRKRNACDPQPLGNGPTISPDTAADFSSATVLSQIARGAAIPSGYKQSFVDQKGSSQQIGYLTYRTYPTYDVQGCADACDGEKYCLGFNIYFERDPSIEPGPGCPNPPSTNNIKCALYGYPVAVNAATNTGQWRQDFQVVIAGSNGYSKTNKGLPTVKDFKAPTSLPAAINAPLDNGYDTYNGMRLFNDNPFDPALCGAACEAQTEYDMAHPDSDGKYKPCNFFTTYILTRNGVPLGTYCALYTRSWDSSYAKNTGYYAGDDTYEVINAGSYEITSPSTGVIPSTSGPGPNILVNPGFETITSAGPSTPIYGWSGTGGYIYPNRLQEAAHGGYNFAVMFYKGDEPNPAPVLSQSLTGLDTTKSYALTFYLDLYLITAPSTCTISVTLGNVKIYTRDLTVNDQPGPYNWKGPITSSPVKPSSREATLSLRYDCVTRGRGTLGFRPYVRTPTVHPCVVGDCVPGRFSIQAFDASQRDCTKSTSRHTDSAVVALPPQ